MRKTFILSVTLFIIFLISGYINNALAKTDGYFWENISDREKQAYITGIIDGAIAVGVEIQFSIDDVSIKKQVSAILDNYDLDEQFDIPQVVSGLNQFYNDYANKKIPVDSAFVIVLKRLRGFPEIELQKEIEILRQVSRKN